VGVVKTLVERRYRAVGGFYVGVVGCVDAGGRCAAAARVSRGADGRRMAEKTRTSPRNRRSKVLEYMREKEHGSTFPLPSLDPDGWTLVRQGGQNYTIEPV
jgi:hypothetical protein